MKRASGRLCYFIVGLAGLCATHGMMPTQQTTSGQEKAKPNPVAPSDPAEKQPSESMNFWMKKKLDFSKNVLEGIALGDFDKVVQNAQTLRSLSKIEAFVRRDTPGYRQQVVQFENSLDELIRNGKKENVEGATLAFHQLTVSCVNCHRQLREAK
jgi:hypothetical protein